MQKYCFIGAAVLFLTACGATVKTVQGGNYQEGSYKINRQDSRINTIACQDLDDWYLDGYRIGKSFHENKQMVLAYRLNYCEQKFHQKVDDNLVSHWERGFSVGEKDRVVPRKGKKAKKRLRKTA